MTNERYSKTQYMIRRLSYHMQVCYELHEDETAQRQNFRPNMDDEVEICKGNEKIFMDAMTHIESAIEELKRIDP